MLHRTVAFLVLVSLASGVAAAAGAGEPQAPKPRARDQRHAALYFGCTLALIVLRWRGQLPSGIPRAAPPVAAAFAAVVYCAWVSLGLGAEPLLWTIVLGGSGVPGYLWSVHVHRRAARPAVEAA